MGGVLNIFGLDVGGGDYITQARGASDATKMIIKEMVGGASEVSAKDMKGMVPALEKAVDVASQMMLKQGVDPEAAATEIKAILDAGYGKDFQPTDVAAFVSGLESLSVKLSTTAKEQRTMAQAPGYDPERNPIQEEHLKGMTSTAELLRKTVQAIKLADPRADMDKDDFAKQVSDIAEEVLYDVDPQLRARIRKEFGIDLERSDKSPAQWEQEFEQMRIMDDAYTLIDIQDASELEALESGQRAMYDTMSRGIDGLR